MILVNTRLLIHKYKYKMKKVINYFSDRQFIFKMILMLLAVVTGGGVMAVGDAVEPDLNEPGAKPATTEETAANEQVDKDKNDLLAPGGKTAGQSLTGTQASATQMDRGGLEEEDWDTGETKFRPYHTPLLSVVKKFTTTVPCTGYKKKHARYGGETLDGEVTQPITAGASIKLTKTNFSGSLKPFYEGSTAIVPTVAGYKRGSTTVREGRLVLFVTSANKAGTEVTLQAVNGKANEEGVDCEFLENMTCPDIPTGTVILAASTALSESQMKVPAENYQPRSADVYLQKRAFSIVFTEDFETMKKKIPHTVKDMKEDALNKYKMRAERSYWMGTKARIHSTTNDGADEYTYFAEGILNQITNEYGIGEVYKYEDLTAISMLMFTDFSESDHIYMFCGKNAIKRLMNIEIPKGRTEVLSTHKEIDITFSRYVDNYGTIDFVWDQTLDMMHMEDCMVGMDLKGARHYVKEKGKDKTNDMSKDGYDPREAKRYMHIEADCIALRGYNSILVGPEAFITNLGVTGIVNSIISLKTLPDTAAKGMKVALTEDYTKDETTYEKGKVYEYDGTKWNLYAGMDVAA